MTYKKSNYLYFTKVKRKYFIAQTLKKDIIEVSFNLFEILRDKNVFSTDDFKKLNQPEIFRALINTKIILPIYYNEVENLSKISKNKEKPNSLESLHIVPTLSCVLNCKYCFVLKNTTLSKKILNIDYDVARKGIDFFFKENTHPKPLVTFYGGEALIKADLMFRCVDYIENQLHKQIEKKIITNAVLVNKEIAQKLRMYNFDVSVSIDGDKNAHNANRVNRQNKGSFKDVIRGYKLLQKAGIKVKILCTVGSHNIKNLEKNTAFLLNLKPSAIALNLPKEIKGSELESGTNPKFIMQKYIKALEMCYIKRIPELHFADLIYGFLTKGIKYRPCSGCGSQIAVAPDNLIGPCQAYVGTGKYFIPRPFDKKELHTNNVFTKWRNVNSFTSNNCASCPIMPICYGDCPFDRENRSGSLLTPSALHCYSRKMMFEYLIKRVASKKSLFFKPSQTT